MNFLTLLAEALDKNIPDDFFKYMKPDDNGLDVNKSHRVNRIIDKHINRKMKDVSSTMFDDNVPAINQYTEDSFPVNTDLWNYKLKGSLRRPTTLKQTNEINAALKTKHLSNDTHVYSGMRSEFKVPEDGIVHIPSFISTSLSPRIANDFSDLHDKKGVFNRRFLRIHLPKGHNGAYVENLSNNRNEQELLLPSNQLLKINHTPKVFDYNQYSTPHKTSMYDARPMTDDEIQAHKDHPEVQSYLRMKELLNV